jgi:hypothetical protein
MICDWRLPIAVGLALAVAGRAERPLNDYSFIRGVNYGMNADQATLERDLGYAKRVNLNSTRIWLNYQAWEKDPQGYIARLHNYIRTSHHLGFSTMPILFHGNGLNPDTLKTAFRTRGDVCVSAIVDALKDEPGLLMWDIMNEPYTSSRFEGVTGDEQKRRQAEITEFVRYQLTSVKKLDPINAITVGYTFAKELEPTADLVDVLSFHDYTALRSTIEDAYRTAEEVSKKTGKPLLNTETGCIARANPYDVVLEIAEKHKTGWYLFNLIIQGYWGEIHGLFYPEEMIRDPATTAAVMGFYRNRNLNTILKPVPNREGHAERVLEAIQAALKDDTSAFRHTKTPTNAMLDAAEQAANLLEASEMVPRYMPPSVQIRFWREQAPEERDRDAIRSFAYDLGLTLKRDCQLY